MTSPTLPVVDPDWTDRQREVLDLLAQEKTNPEIATALDIGLDGAKWHVRIILEKLGVDSRDEAAAYWRHKNRPTAKARGWLRGLFTATALKWAGGGIAALAIAGGAVAGIAYLAADNDDDPNPPAAETPNATTTPASGVEDPDDPTAELPPCPVDDEICEFALDVESILRAGDYESLLEGDDLPISRDEAVATIVNTLGNVGSSRLLAIGCTEFVGVADCDEQFTLSITSRSVPGLVGEWTGTIWLAYERGAGQPVLSSVGPVTNVELIEAILAGERSSRCEIEPESGVADCLPRRFHRYPVAVPPCPVDETACDLALAIEANVQSGDMQLQLVSPNGQLAGSGAVEAAISTALGVQADPFGRYDTVHLAAIGCPFDNTAFPAPPGDCANHVFLALEHTPTGVPRGTGTLALLLYELQPPDGAALLAVYPVTDAETRAALWQRRRVESCGYEDQPPVVADGCIAADFSVYPAAPEIEPVDATPVTLGRTVTLGDSALVLEAGCTQCDGLPVGLYRQTHIASGGERYDELFVNPDADAITGSILGYAISPDASRLAVTTCLNEDCGRGQAFPGPTARSALHISDDGGITWEETAAFDGFVAPIRIEPGRVILKRPVLDSETGWEVFASDTGEILDEPAVIGIPTEFRAPDGQIYEVTLDGRVLLHGEPWFDPGVPVAQTMHVGWSPSGDTASVFWIPAFLDVEVQGPRLTTIRDGVVTRTLEFTNGTYRPWDGFPLLLSEDQAAVPILDQRAASRFVALLDLDTGVLSPIEGAVPQAINSQRAVPAALIEGPFALVFTGPNVLPQGSGGDSDCLNIREAPTLDAPIVTCAANGVLLRHNAETEEDGGTEFLNVTTPAGQTGWASTEFLEWQR